MNDLYRLLIRVSAFLRKEIFEILRQPRLILSLVAGPFLILLLFGIGYQNQPRQLRTIFVVEPGSALEGQIERYASNLGEQLIFTGVTSDQEAALDALERRQIDLVAVTPPDVVGTLRANEQATFTLYHNEIDPFQADYVRYFGRIYIDEVNRRVLRTIADRGQDEAEEGRGTVSEARTNARLMREALERGDRAEARRIQRDLDRNVDTLEGDVISSLDLLEGMEETFGSAEQRADTTALRDEVTSLDDRTGALGEIDDDTDLNAKAREVAELERTLESLDSEIQEFRRINSRVLVSPFRSESQSIARLQPNISAYFAPAVIVLLLQHLAVTFAALSIVRERQIGADELFRVAPISAGETLLGKYLSYLIFGGVISLILTLLIVSNYQPAIAFLQENNVILGLGVPMAGNWINYTLVIAALLFASLGYGFVISAIVDTDSQAVQYAMIVLLTSVFFAGFFLALETLWAPVRAISWALPATYAILLLRQIMLRGELPSPLWLGSLVAIGVFLYLLAWLLIHRAFRKI